MHLFHQERSLKELVGKWGDGDLIGKVYESEFYVVLTA